jgi:succinate-acetate transporter protein
MTTFPPDLDGGAARPAVVMLRPIATPLSLGFAALAVASFTLAALELRWIDPVANFTTVGLVVLAFTAPLQLVAAVYGFLGRDAIAASGLGILFGAWLAIGSTMYTSPAGSTSSGLGIFLIGVATVLTAPALAGLSSKIVADGVMVSVAVRFYLTGAYQLTGTGGWRVAAGVSGLVVAGLALYAAFAYEIEAAQRRTVLPTGRVGPGRAALARDFAEEMAGIEHDPGVRRQL